MACWLYFLRQPGVPLLLFPLNFLIPCYGREGQVGRGASELLPIALYCSVRPSVCLCAPRLGWVLQHQVLLSAGSVQGCTSSARLACDRSWVGDPGSHEQQKGVGDLWECPALDGCCAGSPVVRGLVSSALSNHRTTACCELDGTRRNPRAQSDGCTQQCPNPVAASGV